MSFNSTVILAFTNAMHPAIDAGNEISISSQDINTEAYHSIINEMANVKRIQSLHDMTPNFSKNVKVNGVSLSEKFDENVLFQVAAQDSTDIPSSVSGGYSDCYSNCHGSRGWR